MDSHEEPITKRRRMMPSKPCTYLVVKLSESEDASTIFNFLKFCINGRGIITRLNTLYEHPIVQEHIIAQQRSYEVPTEDSSNCRSEGDCANDSDGSLNHDQPIHEDFDCAIVKEPMNIPDSADEGVPAVELMNKSNPIADHLAVGDIPVRESLYALDDPASTPHDKIPTKQEIDPINTTFDPHKVKEESEDISPEIPSKSVLNDVGVAVVQKETCLDVYNAYFKYVKAEVKVENPEEDELVMFKKTFPGKRDALGQLLRQQQLSNTALLFVKCELCHAVVSGISPIGANLEQHARTHCKNMFMYQCQFSECNYSDESVATVRMHTIESHGYSKEPLPFCTPQSELSWNDFYKKCFPLFVDVPQQPAHELEDGEIQEDDGEDGEIRENDKEFPSSGKLVKPNKECKSYVQCKVCRQHVRRDRDHVTYLLRHMKTHCPGCREFECPVKGCGYSSAVMGAVKRHTKQIHASDIQPLRKRTVKMQRQWKLCFKKCFPEIADTVDDKIFSGSTFIPLSVNNSF